MLEATAERHDGSTSIMGYRGKAHTPFFVCDAGVARAVRKSGYLQHFLFKPLIFLPTSNPLQNSAGYAFLPEHVSHCSQADSGASSKAYPGLREGKGAWGSHGQKLSSSPCGQGSRGQLWARATSGRHSPNSSLPRQTLLLLKLVFLSLWSKITLSSGMFIFTEDGSCP